MEKLIKTIKENKEEIAGLVKQTPDWEKAATRMDAQFRRMSDPADATWSASHFNTFKEVYFDKRDKDQGMSNIVVRTVTGMPDALKDTARIMFLQMAEVCCVFNTSHKVNFAEDELPEHFVSIKMVPAKTKGSYTYADPTPSIYKKTSLTFDYWVPKMLEWTEEIRAKKLQDWRNSSILEHESCTDFMRICLLFLSDTHNYPPVAKAEDRQALMALLGKEFAWLKKSAKREDITGNNAKMAQGFAELNARTGVAIPMEAWSRIQQAPFLKGLLK